MKLSLPTVALGAAIAAVPTVLVRIAVVGPVHVAGVPTAEDMVTINTEGVTVASGQTTAPIFDVPSNRWLVITGMTLSGSYAGGLYEARGSVRDLKLQLSQTFSISGSNGHMVFNGRSPFPIAFAPGSVAELGTGANGNIMSMTFSGYLE